MGGMRGMRVPSSGCRVCYWVGCGETGDACSYMSYRVCYKGMLGCGGMCVLSLCLKLCYWCGVGFAGDACSKLRLKVW